MTGPGITLPSGAYVVFRRHGVHAGDPRCTIHLEDIWRSQASHDAGDPYWQRQTHYHHAPGPMVDPAGAILAAIDSHLVNPDNARISGDHSHRDCPWGEGSDCFGNLSHPSMSALTAVPE